LRSKGGVSAFMTSDWPAETGRLDPFKPTRAEIDREGFSNRSESAKWTLSKGGTMLSLKTMTESKLKVLKREIEAAIHAKITARRQEIESELSRLSLLDGSARGKVVRAAARRTDAPKYRNSESARKLAGRKLDESLIADRSEIPETAKQPKKTKKTKKARNAGDLTPAVLLTSAKIEHTEPLCIEPLDCPLPVEPLSGASL
jgi:hypothetical protein